MSTVVQEDPETSSVAEGRITDLIRDAIVRGDYAPNQRLIEADLSATFSASRATVRMALLELANEGLVERLPNRGSRVRAISLDEAIEILEVRIGVEGLCAAKAAENITADQIEEFERLREEMVASVADGDLVEYSASTSASTGAHAKSAGTRPPPRCSDDCTLRACVTNSSCQGVRAGPRCPSSNTQRSSTRSSPATPRRRKSRCASTCSA